MDDRPQPDPNEINVTSNDTSTADDGGRWSRRRAGSWEGDAHEVIVRQSSEEQPGRSDPGQRRLFAIAAIVGVIALVLGWMIGRTGSGDDVSSSSLTTPVTSEVEGSSSPGETLSSVAPTTTRSQRATTTTLAPGLAPLPLYLVDVDPRLEGVELTLIGLEQQHVLAELDIARETLIRRDFGPFSAESSSIVVGDDWVVVGGDFEAGNSRVVHDDGSFEQVDLGEFWQPLREAGTDRFWRPLDTDGWGPPTLFEQVDLTGRPTGAAIELPTNSGPSGSDPSGGLIVEAAGDLYSVDASSVSHLGSGDLIGISGDVMVRWDCDEQLRCGLYVTDRLSGDVRRLDVDLGDDMIEGLDNWTEIDSQTISPDGSLCAVLLMSDDEPRMTLIDLASGATLELGDRPFLPVVAWSPDDRFVFLLANVDGEPYGGGWGWGWGGEGDLYAYDRQSGDVFPVLSEPVEWQTISTRPGPA